MSGSSRRAFFRELASAVAEGREMLEPVVAADAESVPVRPLLTDEEVDTIARWADGGAPKGDDSDMPKMPALAVGWTIGKPDAIFAMAEPFHIPANGAVEYQYIRIPTGITEDKWLAAIEIKPEARAQVHHVIAFTVPAGSPVKYFIARIRGGDVAGIGSIPEGAPPIVAWNRSASACAVVPPWALMYAGL